MLEAFYKYLAIGVEANVIDKSSIKKARDIVLKRFGPCDILLNGASGNHPMGTTTKEYLYKGDLDND